MRRTQKLRQYLSHKVERIFLILGMGRIKKIRPMRNLSSPVELHEERNPFLPLILQPSNVPTFPNYRAFPSDWVSESKPIKMKLSMRGKRFPENARFYNPRSRSHIQKISAATYLNDLPRLLAMEPNDSRDNRAVFIDPLAAGGYLTSNFIPLVPSKVKKPEHCDFTSLMEYVRFLIRPPISREEVEKVDVDALLKALINKKS